jgi:hypothetical protein
MVPALVLGSNDSNQSGKYTKEKKIHKEFTVDSDAVIKLDNSYGNLDITTWDENRVVIDVTITTNGNSEEKTQKKLDAITVDFDNSSSEVTARTRFNNNKSKSWWSWGKNKVNMKINYIVKIPITNSVDLSNDYGNINMDKLQGQAKISCDYGKITTKELMAEGNILRFDYTKHSYFEYINSGTIKADYSGYTVGKANDLTIVADYSQSEIEAAEDVTYNCDYGGLTLHKVNNVTGNGDYLTLKLGDVHKNVHIKADYGSLKIDNMTDNAGDIFIESDYLKMTIGHSSGYNFKFEIDLERASLTESDGFEFIKQRVESGDKYYSGYYGSSDAPNTVRISSDHGGVTFKRN